MVLTRAQRAQTKTSPVTVPAKQTSSARGATASSRSKTKPKDEAEKSTIKTQAVSKPKVDSKKTKPRIEAKPETGPAQSQARSSDVSEPKEDPIKSTIQDDAMISKVESDAPKSEAGPEIESKSEQQVVPSESRQKKPSTIKTKTDVARPKKTTVSTAPKKDLSKPARSTASTRVKSETTTRPTRTVETKPKDASRGSRPETRTKDVIKKRVDTESTDESKKPAVRAKRPASKPAADQPPAKKTRQVEESNGPLTLKVTTEGQRIENEVAKMKEMGKQISTPPETLPTTVASMEMAPTTFSIVSKIPSPIKAPHLSPLRNAPSPTTQLTLTASPFKAISPVKLATSTLLQTPRRSQAIRSTIKDTPAFKFSIPEFGTQTPSHGLNGATSTLHESPRRSKAVCSAAMQLTAASNLLAQSHHQPDITGQSLGLSSSLMSFKLSGTPMRRAVGHAHTVKAPKTMGTSIMTPMKRSVAGIQMETPIRPRSVQAEKRTKLFETPQRPRSFEMGIPAAPNSCFKRQPDFLSVGMNTGKKTVSFHNAEQEISPMRSDLLIEDVTMTETVDPLQLRMLTPITEKSGERSSISFGVLDSAKTTEASINFENSILADTVFYLDIWGTNGMEANQYFEPLLEEMGASISKQWSDEVTHVLFKDGSEHTLKRVIQSNVYCVNVGWAVE
jgi:hypothetical protein